MQGISKNISKILLSSLLAMSIVAGAAIYHLYNSRPKIAYVRSLELIYGYNGMKSAHAEFKTQAAQWQANIDTLKANYQKLQSELSSLPQSERREKEVILVKMKQDFEKYASVINQEAKAKEASLTEGVLNQVNSYVQRFAKLKGYDLVLGSEQSGSIIYGKEAFDITDEVLNEMNKEYKTILPTAMNVSAND